MTKRGLRWLSMPRRVDPSIKKTKPFQVRCGVAQHERYFRAAEARGVGVSDVARLLLDRWSDEVLSMPSVLQPDGIPPREIRRVVRDELQGHAPRVAAYTVRRSKEHRDE